MPNPFEAGTRKVIPAVLVYAFDGLRVLLIHRVAPDRADDYHAGKWNGLGGKLELDESPLEGARRELREESGLDLPLDRFRALGTLQFPNFKAHKAEDWVVFVFRAEVRPDEASETLA
ncbi:MAG TPA: NUDIX domain-containing protein, partial [Bdellovibrionota bacterium]|nr:NUDIX domain-containing protein [Bdellovibrionota bacterium]